MGSRLELQSKLEILLGTENVYFQPPATVRLVYPCIIYNRSNIKVEHADNMPYTMKKRYTVTVIDRNPDSVIGESILQTLPLCNYDRAYAADNLNHDVLTVYY